MELDELYRPAGGLGVEYAPRRSEVSLIRAIQRRQGQLDGFATDERFTCTGDGCRWRQVCLKPIATWHR